ncbi:MAG TPA: hypothetical protein VKD28_18595 [Gemmatimonadales bacterium]|nr:hypothetical protein [Gemmatimonadales bacterium]
MKKQLALASLAAFVLACQETPVDLGKPAFDVGAGNSGMNLHPRGFGENSFAAWRAKEGLPDDNGKANQALYLQKFTATATFAAAVVIIDGLEGTPAADLTKLSWEHRNDGWCGAGAPRWNIGLTDADGVDHTVMLGCYYATHSTGGATDWTKDEFSQADITAAIVAAGVNPADATIRGLAIVFDEGTDVPLNPGFVYLDNITVNTTVWKSPSANSK